MLIKCRLLILFLLISFCAFAQEDEEEVEIKVNINSNRKYKNEVGLDIAPFQFILGNSSASYPSLFYRRHFIKTKAAKSLAGVNITSYHAYRFRMGSNFSFDALEIPDIKTNWGSLTNYYVSDRRLNGTSSFFVRIGKEKQIRSKRFELFYGYDFFINYDYSYDYYLYTQYYNSGQSTAYSFNQDWTYKITNYSFGVASIGGFKYFLIPRLCFSAEATINFSYFRQEKINAFRQYNNSTKEYSEQSLPLANSGGKININPIYVVNIGYYF